MIVIFFFLESSLDNNKSKKNKNGKYTSLDKDIIAVNIVKII